MNINDFFKSTDKKLDSIKNEIEKNKLSEAEFEGFIKDRVEAFSKTLKEYEKELNSRGIKCSTSSHDDSFAIKIYFDYSSHLALSFDKNRRDGYYDFESSYIDASGFKVPNGESIMVKSKSDWNEDFFEKQIQYAINAIISKKEKKESR